MEKIRVAVYGGQCGGSYGLLHVSGYSIWEVRINDIGERTSVKLIGDNVENPSAKALHNWVQLHIRCVI